jgi:mannan endo-1,4-beta-mannosidase
MRWIFCLMLVVFGASFSIAQHSFVKQKGLQFELNGKPYYYVGTNYWYGSTLVTSTSGKAGLQRLRKELDFLQSKGVTNLRVLAGAEGSGLVNGVERVQPALQYEKGRFEAKTLDGLDVLLSEMGKRQMKAVIFLSNNWEWSGGFLQYLRWNNRIEDSVFRRKLTWDELRDYVSLFYQCDSCMKDYERQLDYILARKNKVTGIRYVDDPAIMAWELANEPRPMRPASNEAYQAWIGAVAARIKSQDKNHLVTIGHEGEMGTESLPLFEAIHAIPQIDYLTIHIWPKNWGWFQQASMKEDFGQVIQKTTAYINKHIDVANKLKKPLVIEEFGLPRDGHSFDLKASTSLRDTYYGHVFSIWQQHSRTGGPLAGVMFWAFGGTARPQPGQLFWKDGDDYMGDPPMEEQGLNTVFDSDASTWAMIRGFTRAGTPIKKKS